MYKNKWIFNGVAIAITAGMVLVNADQAQSIPNLSDITGSNNFSAPTSTTSFDSGSSSGGGSPAVIQQNSATADSISQELTDAIQDASKTESTPKGPRHFARKSSENCANPSVAKAERLSETVEKAQNFLNEVNQTSSNSGNTSPW